MNKPLTILLSGGGTGGHIFPAIAIADALKKKYPHAHFHFVGARDRMEMQQIPRAGYGITGLWIAGFNRQKLLKNCLLPFKIIFSFFKAYRLICKYQPKIVIGTGGFASGLLLYVAGLKKIPTLIQEQNAYPGMTNRFLGAKAHKICVAYDGLEKFFPCEKIIKTGNPIRQNLRSVSKLQQPHFKTNPTEKTLLILGGSLGAARINELVATHLDFFKQQNIRLIWQTGAFYIERYKHLENSSVVIRSFLEDMNGAYATADFIIARAGAGVVSELAVVGKPVLLIPSPNVADDHQTKNAQALVKKDAALLLKESDFEHFKAIFYRLIDPVSNKKLADNIKKFALPNATEHIVKEIQKIIER